MDCSRLFFGDTDDQHHHHQPRPSPKKQLQLQGPRPTPLQVCKDSHAIRKPPRHPPPNPSPSANPPPPASASDDPRQPVIIYAVSPKVIHVEESDFMSLVQRLTGLSPSGPRAGDVSSAARFASIEKASPKHRPVMAGLNGVVRGNQEMMSSAVEGFDLAVASRGSVPGILSTAPSSLLAIPSGVFSPVKDSPAVPLFQDLGVSPFLPCGTGSGYGSVFTGAGGSSIVSSPSAWFSPTMISPSPTSLDLYNLFANF